MGTGHRWGRSEIHTPLMEKPERKRPLGRLGHRWEDSIKIDLKTQDGVVWIGSMWLKLGANFLLFCIL